MSGGKRLSGNKLGRLDDQIKRAAALALISETGIAELYLLHKELCEESRTHQLQRPLRASD